MTYVVKYDFELKREQISIPKGCKIDFQGGSLNNGTIKTVSIRNSKIDEISRFQCGDGISIEDCTIERQI